MGWKNGRLMHVATSPLAAEEKSDDRCCWIHEFYKSNRVFRITQIIMLILLKKYSLLKNRCKK